MITVVIPTHNRASFLAHCLQSLSQQVTTLDDWAVLVVDNASTDNTRQVTEAAAARFLRIGYVYAPTLGCSSARNMGLKSARSRYILYVDDECTFPADYIEKARRVIDDRRPACFGGPVLPRHMADAPVPYWFKEDYGAFSLPQDNPPGALPRLSAGNLGFECEVLRAVGGFDQNYGSVGSRMRFGEENVAIARVGRHCGLKRVVYDPSLVNFHHVRVEKYGWRHILAENFMRGYARGQLAAVGLAEQVTAKPGRRVALLPLAGQLFSDAVLLPRWTDPLQFPYWQNVVYERWMGYVRNLGLLIGRMYWRFRIGAVPS